MSTLVKKICLVATVLTFAACHSKPAPAPQSATTPASNPAVNPAPAPAAPVQPQVPSAAALDGDWTGDSGKDLPVSFSVKNNQVSQIYISYRSQKGGCSAFASFTADSNATLNGKAFSLKGVKDQMKDHIEYTMNGTFTSDKEASGTLHWVGKSDLCGDIDVQANWTAKKGSGSGSDSDAELPDKGDD